MSSTTTSWRPVAGGGEPGDPVVGHLHRVALGDQPAPHHLRQRHLVLDQQHPHDTTLSAPGAPDPTVVTTGVAADVNKH